jgi:hypothetical protein
MMTFLETLKSNRGGLIKLKSQLWWYDGRGWDNRPGRVCLIIDATVPDGCVSDASVPGALSEFIRCGGAVVVAALLLIDGSPKWIWIKKEDIEILTDNQNNRLAEKE